MSQFVKKLLTISHFYDILICKTKIPGEEKRARGGFVKIVLAILAFAVLASAQNWVEERTYVSGGAATPRIDGLLTQSIKGNLGSFEWFQVQQGYSQAYAGATYSPKPWLQFALGGGLEEAKSPARLGSYIWMGKGKLSGLFVFEDGGSGIWFKTEANYQVFSKLGVGMLSERFKGTGLKFELSVPHTRLKAWFAPLFQNGKADPVVGVRYAL